MRLVLAIALMTSAVSTAGAQSSSAPRPPIAEKRPKVDVLHGETRRDDYFYMRDRTDSSVLRYLAAENAYTDAQTAHSKPLEDSLYAEMVARIKETDAGVPVERHGYFYYTRTEQGKAYPIFCRRKRSMDGPEEVYFDQNEAAKASKFYQLGAFEVSPDGRYLALLVDLNGYEDFELQVKDLATGTFLADKVQKLGFGLAWASDGRTVLYATTNSAKRTDQIWRHRVGDAQANDVSLYREPDVLFNLQVSRDRSGDWLVITSASFTQSEVRVLDANRPDSPLRLVAARRPNVEYTVAGYANGRFFIVANDNGATNFRIVTAPVSDPSPERWTAYMPYDRAVFVETVDVFRDWVVSTERHDGLRRLRVIRLADTSFHDVSFPEAAYGVTLAENPEYAATALRFTYSSFVTPASVYDYDLANRTRELRKRTEVLGGYDPERYVVERIYATARDGTRIPISLVRRKDAPRDGTAPLLLYAYGSYGATIEPTFASGRLSLVDRGVQYAIAHIRGGQEMGRAWYDDGKMLRKMNTFTDFIDCADFLVAGRFTSPDRLIAHGGSAGGLLMGVVANLRPELWRAVVADVPFVDVINTMLDASIPLTAQEWEQWGNPQKPEEYAYMRSYSPYDNVEAKAYPRMLVMSALNDSRVAYWEPTKWVARMRATKTDQNPLYLRMIMDAGHGGASGRYSQIREAAFRYAFILDALPRTPAVVP